MNPVIYEENRLGTRDRVVCIRLASSTTPATIYHNRHREVEFLYIESGQLCLHIETEEYLLSAGDIAIVNMNRAH